MSVKSNGVGTNKIKTKNVPLERLNKGIVHTNDHAVK